MINITVHETCYMTGKWMLSEREAGNIVRVAKKANNGKNIPKGIYVCPFCGTYHTTHYAQSNDQKRKNAAKKLPAYNRNKEPKLRVYDYM